MSNTKEVYFIKQFRKYIKKDADAKTLSELSYLANQILEVGACGVFNPNEHKDFTQDTKKSGGYIPHAINESQDSKPPEFV